MKAARGYKKGICWLSIKGDDDLPISFCCCRFVPNHLEPQVPAFPSWRDQGFLFSFMVVPWCLAGPLFLFLLPLGINLLKVPDRLLQLSVPLLSWGAGAGLLKGEHDDVKVDRAQDVDQSRSVSFREYPILNTLRKWAPYSVDFADYSFILPLCEQSCPFQLGR